jgi:hypothetical protein
MAAKRPRELEQVEEWIPNFRINRVAKRLKELEPVEEWRSRQLKLRPACPQCEDIAEAQRKQHSDDVDDLWGIIFADRQPL